MSAAERLRLVVLSDVDPVARGIAVRWGTPAATGDHVDGAAVRRVDTRLLCLRRPGPHLHDERLDLRLPASLVDLRPTLVFPSVHRSESGTRCLTVHPLGNTGPGADLGGRPGAVVPTDPRGMAGLLRALIEEGRPIHLPATFEATHHGPEVGLPAYFAEIAVSGEAAPLPEELTVLERAIRVERSDPRDRVALAVGGGHYAPRFTDLVRSRRWAFGHILSRHALREISAETAVAAFRASEGAEGVLFARTQDREHAAVAGLGPELREADAPRREEGPGDPTSRTPRSAGTG